MSGLGRMSSEQLMIKFKQIYNRCAHSVDSWVKAKVLQFNLAYIAGTAVFLGKHG